MLDLDRARRNTSCVELKTSSPEHLVVLDAGTGIRGLGTLAPPVERVDVLLSHLHMDHIIGLGFAELTRADDPLALVMR